MTDEAIRTAAPGPDRERASLGAIAYHLGDLRPIEEIDFLRDEPGRLELYRLAGFERYAQSDLTMRQLAALSAAETLDRSGIDPADIPICLYVAESFDRDEAVNSAEVNRLLVGLGMEKALPISIAISNCANIMAALRVATVLIETGEAEHVLVVSVDKASRRHGGRKMFQEISIKSDGSVSCLVSRPGVGGYGIYYLGQHNAAALVDADMASPSAYALPKFQGIRHGANCARSALRLGSDDFARIITNNYSREVSRMFVQLCGFEGERGYFENIAHFAHVVAGDVLINLSHLAEARAIGPGDRVFVMADSITTSSIMCLQTRPAPPPPGGSVRERG